jgi:hypothetical protein
VAFAVVDALPYAVTAALDNAAGAPDEVTVVNVKNTVEPEEKSPRNAIF